MVNPHWEEIFTEEVPVRDDWGPLGEYGQHGEFEGWQLQDDPPSYTSDYQDYPEMGDIPSDPLNPFRVPEEEVSIYDNWPPAGRPPYPEQYWIRPRGKSYPPNIGYDRAGPIRGGPPSNIGYDRAGPIRGGPPSNIGYDRAGPGIGPPHEEGLPPSGPPGNWWDKIPWWLLPPPLGVGIETLLGGDPGSNEELMQMAQMGGYGYNPDPNKTYDDYYTGQDIIDMEILPGVGYDPEDEYYFDKKQGYKNRIWDMKPSYTARGGLI